MTRTTETTAQSTSVHPEGTPPKTTSTHPERTNPPTTSTSSAKSDQGPVRSRAGQSVPDWRRGASAVWSPPVAAQHQGVFTARQAADAGCRPRQIEYRLTSGAWRRVVGRGLILASTPLRFEHGAWAGVLTWPDGVLWGPTALRLWHADAPIPNQGAVHLAVPHSRRCQTKLIRHVRPDVIGRATSLQGLPVASQSDAVADCLLALPHDATDRLTSWLISRQAIDSTLLNQVMVSRPGCRGAVRLRQIIAKAQAGIASHLEGKFHDLLKGNEITGWEANVPIRLGGRIIASADICFEAQRLIFEVDGSAYHSSVEAVRADLERQNRVNSAGYRMVRFSYDEITNHPQAVIERVKRALSQTW